MRRGEERGEERRGGRGVRRGGEERGGEEREGEGGTHASVAVRLHPIMATHAHVMLYMLLPSCLQSYCCFSLSPLSLLPTQLSRWTLALPAPQTHTLACSTTPAMCGATVYRTLIRPAGPCRYIYVYIHVHTTIYTCTAHACTCISVLYLECLLQTSLVRGQSFLHSLLQQFLVVMC